MRTLFKILLALCAVVALALIYLLATLDKVPARVSYGATFSTLYAEELGLDWRAVYRATLDDLGVRKLRIPAYWPRIETSRDSYDWSELDFMVRLAAERDAKVILAIGRRVPRWPECHIPHWTEQLSEDERKDELLELLEALVTRYRGSPAVEYWQVENEAYLSLFAFEHCGELDEELLDEEIRLVRSLDDRPILLTDSGNLGLWLSPYKRGDSFGTSLYMYFWNPEVGQFKTKVPPIFYRAKDRIAELVHGEKPVYLIELSLEPWLTQAIVETPRETQLSRMDMEKFNEILAYARRTSFERQYLWGVEWWYYMRERNHPEFWDAARDLF